MPTPKTDFKPVPTNRQWDRWRCHRCSRYFGRDDPRNEVQLDLPLGTITMPVCDDCRGDDD